MARTLPILPAPMEAPFSDIGPTISTAWTASSFYARFAFHRRGYQGIERVLRVGEHGIEAELVTTALSGLSHEGLGFAPALLDCTGQLVAFWLLARGVTHFGVFPYRARRVTWCGEPLSPGCRVRCRGRIRFDDSGYTEASFELTHGDRVVARVEGLAQRFVPFPRVMHQMLFAPEPPEVALTEVVGDGPAACTLDARDWHLLSASWGVWARALAHLVLREPERLAWYRVECDAERRAYHLLVHLAAKEAVRRWAAANGEELRYGDIELDGLLGRRPEPRVAIVGSAPMLATPQLQVSSQASVIRAKVGS